MSHPSILILGYSESAMLLRQSHAAGVKAIVSIHSAHEPPLETVAGIQRLTLRFDDVEATDPADPLGRYRAWVQQKWAAEVGRPLTAPTTDDARAIIDFARSIADIAGAVLCQCQAGISRSSAAALLCLATWRGAGEESSCVEQMLRVRPSAVPLQELVLFGDSLLGRGGKLVRALSRARS